MKTIKPFFVARFGTGLPKYGIPALKAGKPYKGDVPKEIGWGDVISLEEAKEFMEPIDG